MRDLLDELNLEKIKIAFSRLERFDEEAEIVDALGKYIVLYELDWDLESIRKELATLGLESKFKELVQKLESGSYKYYTGYCHDRNPENTLSLYEQLIENKDVSSVQKIIGKE